MRLQRITLGTQLAGQLQLADRDLLQIDTAVQQVIETSRGKHELEPPHTTERVQLLDVRLEGAHVLLVDELVARELKLRIRNLRLDRLRLRSDGGEVGVALRQLGL